MKQIQEIQTHKIKAESDDINTYLKGTIDGNNVRVVSVSVITD